MPAIVAPLPQFFDLTGAPLEAGFVHIGAFGGNPETSPVTVYWDEAMTQPAAQPLRTSRGCVMRAGTPAAVYVSGPYSLTTKQRTGERVIYAADVTQADADAVPFVQAGTGAVSRTVQAKLRDFVSILDFIPATEHAAIQAGTSTYDCYTAIMAAINSVTYQGTFVPGPYRAGPAIYFPPGIYLCNSTLHLKKRVTLWGDGSGKAYGDASIIKWPADTLGMVFHNINTDSSGTVASTTGAAASVLRGLALVSAGGTDTAAHGVWCRTRVSIENIYVENFPGDGIHIRASAGLGGFDEGNANSWSIIGGRVNDCGRHGLYVDGADGNAGFCLGLDSMANGGWGIYDSSFLGNSYEGCHTASNGLGGYKTDNLNAACVFLACYSEGGQPGNELIAPSISIGGTQGAGFGAGNTAPHISAGGDGLIISESLVPMKGLNFTTVPSNGNSNILDRYREGTWSPSATGMTVVGTASYQGRYTVIGNTVYFTVEVSVSGGTTASTGGTTSITLPGGYAPLERDTAMVVDTGVVNLGIGLIDTAAGGSIKPPTWSARAATVVISGQYRIAT